MTKIYAKGQAFERELQRHRSRQWNNCFYQLQNSTTRSPPTANCPSSNRSRHQSGLLHETDSAQSRRNRIIHLVETGLQSINPMTVRPQDTPATRQMAS